MQRLAMRWRSAILLPFLVLALVAGRASAQEAAAPGSTAPAARSTSCCPT